MTSWLFLERFVVCSALLAGLQHVEDALGHRVIEYPELEGLMTHKDHQSTTHIISIHMNHMVLKFYSTIPVASRESKTQPALNSSSFVTLLPENLIQVKPRY